MGASTTGWASRAGELDERWAWLEIPLGMARGHGLVWRRRAWRLVIGSPAWSTFTGLPVEPAWQRDPSTGESWSDTAKTATDPAGDTLGPVVGLEPDVIMGLEPGNTFNITPGSVETDASTGSMSAAGAAVTLATSGADTQARVATAKGWMDWVPWILLAGAAMMALNRRKE